MPHGLLCNRGRFSPQHDLGTHTTNTAAQPLDTCWRCTSTSMCSCNGAASAGAAVTLHLILPSCVAVVGGCSVHG